MFRTSGINRIELNFSDARLNYGSGTTVVTVHSGDNSFSFFLRDVTADFPIYIPDYNVIVSLASDKRSYNDIQNEIKGRKLRTNLQKIEALPEESFDSASVHTRNQICPTWLGISRDIRIFEISTLQDMDLIVPRMASSPVNLPETNNTGVTYGYMTGRGQGVENNRGRRLDEGVLPILHTTQLDGDIEYSTTTFVTLESSSLLKDKAIGTHYLVADNSSYGHMFTPAQEDALKFYTQEESKKLKRLFSGSWPLQETSLQFQGMHGSEHSAPVPAGGRK